MLLKIHTLGSSSSGCCYLLHFDKGVLALDLGCKLPQNHKVSKFYVTHKHGDHELPINYKLIKEDSTWHFEESFEMNVKHDSDNSMKQFGETKALYFKMEGLRVLYLTDCGDIEDFMTKYKDDLQFIIRKGLDLLMIECNWDYFTMINKPNKNFHDIRTMSEYGHMSNWDTLQFIYKIKIKPETRILFLHKSSTNASYDTTYKMFEHLPNQWKIAKANQTIYWKTWKEV